jgi:hypothetical protein
LNQHCALAPDLESILRGRMSKIVLQHYLHLAALDLCDAMSAIGESGRRIPGAPVGQSTETCLESMIAKNLART